MNPPGWYPDPSGPDRLRFWDGRSWTEATKAVGGADPGDTIPVSDELSGFQPVASSNAGKVAVIASVVAVVVVLLGAIVAVAISRASGDSVQAVADSGPATPTEPKPADPPKVVTPQPPPVVLPAPPPADPPLERLPTAAPPQVPRIPPQPSDDGGYVDPNVADPDPGPVAPSGLDIFPECTDGAWTPVFNAWTQSDDPSINFSGGFSGTICVDSFGYSHLSALLGSDEFVDAVVTTGTGPWVIETGDRTIRMDPEVGVTIDGQESLSGPWDPDSPRWLSSRDPQ
jgi:hypothetical protein